MGFIQLFTAAAALAGVAQAVPLEKRQGENIDVTVLQFALTLEHLENDFYKGVMQQFSEADFLAAGFSATYYNNLKFISSDEAVHVKALSDALTSVGETPVEPCTYSFPYTDVRSFITLSSVLEGVGTSAYLGVAPLHISQDYLTVAGSILAVEALHTSYQRAAIGNVPFANPFYTPLDPTSVFTLAGMFIQSCPASNPSLPFMPYPSLTVKGETCTCDSPDCPPQAGDTVELQCENHVPEGSFVTFVSGLDVVSVQAEGAGDDHVSAMIPDVASGQIYVFVTKSDVEGKFDGTQVLCGPAVLEVYPTLKV